jgi:hypothetical protein
VVKAIRRAQGNGGLGSQRLGSDRPLADAKGFDKFYGYVQRGLGGAGGRLICSY